MYVEDSRKKSNKYGRVLIREDYKEDGKYKKRTVLNLTKFSDDTIEAFKLALKNRKDISKIQQLADGKSEKGKSVGALIVLNKIAKRLGIKKALGHSRFSKLALWLVFARLIDPGSRLSAVRLAKSHAVTEIINLSSFNEDDLYATLDWVYENKKLIEKRLFRFWKKKQKGFDNIFLYDVTSSYFEGKENELAAWGYNRDKKKGKKQVVYGMLTSSDGEPLGVEVFPGNTKDTKTFPRQIEKIGQDFGCKNITFVGDKGMLKKPQIKELTKNKNNYHYITSISKPEIKTLIKEGCFQLSLFSEEIMEVKDEESGIRYIMRRNPFRVEEIRLNRHSKIDHIKEKLKNSNSYLANHLKAQPIVQIKNLNEKIEKLRLSNIIQIKQDQNNKRVLLLEIKEEELEKASELDGCYVIKTDLPTEEADTRKIHDRYKSLSLVEWTFRTSKDFLNVRPIYLRKKERTTAHLLLVMLAYKIERYLRVMWRKIDLTVPEGIDVLSQFSSTILTIGENKTVQIPRPGRRDNKLLKPLNIKLPTTIPYKEVKIDTRKKLKK